MKGLFEYREKLIKRFQEAAQDFCAACESTNGSLAKIESDWTLHQIASHTRDVQKLVYGVRIERTLKEDDPYFDGFDADEWMAAHYNPKEPLAGILDELMSNVNELCVILTGLPSEAWSRESRHAELGGGLTLQLWVERGLAHIEEHLKTVRQARNA
jgi:hypothetical protein